MSVVKDSALVAIDGTVIVIAMVTAGILSMRWQILDKASAESISKLILNILLPCLLFTQMIQFFDISSLSLFGIIFFFCTAHTVIGVFLGWIIGKLLRSKRDVRRLIMNCIGFQDTTAIPLVFATVLGNNSTINGGSKFEHDATKVVLIYTVFTTLYKWTISFALMKPSADLKMHPLNTTSIGASQEIIVKESGCLWTIKKIMNPPIYATIAAIILALIPYSKEYVFLGSGSVLGGNLFKALVMLGTTVSPMISLMLGCNLSKGYPDGADITWIEIVSIYIGKEVFVPLAGLGLCGVAYDLGLMDKVTMLMLLIIFATPTSLQLLMICTVHKNQVENISKLLLIMYVTAAVPMALWTMSFIIIIYG